MVPLNSFAPALLAQIIRQQPPSPARTALAWQIAVGAAISRRAQVSLEDGLLLVQVRNTHWAAELQGARETIVTRMRALLGPGEVREMRVECDIPDR